LISLAHTPVRFYGAGAERHAGSSPVLGTNTLKTAQLLVRFSVCETEYVANTWSDYESGSRTTKFCLQNGSTPVVHFAYCENHEAICLVTRDQVPSSAQKNSLQRVLISLIERISHIIRDVTPLVHIGCPGNTKLIP